MANSRFAYVRSSELSDVLLPSTFLIIRLDGKGFTKFSRSHAFAKPNDSRALELMNAAARRVARGREMNSECGMAFGESDEYSLSLSFQLTRATGLLMGSVGRVGSCFEGLVNSLVEEPSKSTPSPFDASTGTDSGVPTNERTAS